MNQNFLEIMLTKKATFRLRSYSLNPYGRPSLSIGQIIVSFFLDAS